MENNRITEIIKKESDERNNILEELEKNMFSHNKKIKEFENKAKTLDILRMKYDNLERESKEAIEKCKKRMADDSEQIENLQTEVQVLRKTILSYKNKVNSLQSIIALMVNDFGIDQVALASGISNDKIQEYLDDKI